MLQVIVTELVTDLIYRSIEEKEKIMNSSDSNSKQIFTRTLLK